MKFLPSFLIVAMIVLLASDEHLGTVFARTLLLCLCCVPPAVAIGGILAWYVRFYGRGRHIVAVSTLVPLLIPSVTTGMMAVWIGAHPYSMVTEIIALTVTALPLTYLTQYMSFRSLSDDVIAHGLMYGRDVRTCLRRIIWPHWRNGLWLAIGATIYICLTDSSLTLALGRHEPVLSSYAFHTIVTGSGSGTLARLVVFYILLALLVTWAGMRIPWLSTLRRPQRRIKPSFEKSLVAISPVVWVVVAASVLVVAVCIFYARQPLWSTDIGVVAIVVPLSLIVGSISATWPWRRPRLVHGTAVFTLLMSPVAFGLILGTLGRRNIDVGPVTIPPIVGSGSFGDGYIAVVLASLSVAVPVAHLAMTLAIADKTDMIEAARISGSGPIRTLVTVILPTVLPTVGVIAVAMMGLLVTRTAPLVFVQSAGMTLFAPTLVQEAGRGELSAVLGHTGWFLIVVSVCIAVIVVGGKVRARR